MTLFFCALHPALWMCATVSAGMLSIASFLCCLSLLHSSQPGLARAPIMCSHFPHGNEHVITCVARLFFASWIAPDVIHNPRNSLLSPCLRKNSAAHVVSAQVFLSSTSWSWSIHFHPQRVLSIKSHLMPVQAPCLIRAHLMSVVRRISLLQLQASSVQYLLLQRALFSLLQY
jgi:hypothetical protein